MHCRETPPPLPHNRAQLEQWQWGCWGHPSVSSPWQSEKHQSSSPALWPLPGKRLWKQTPNADNFISSPSSVSGYTQRQDQCHRCCSNEQKKKENQGIPVSSCYYPSPVCSHTQIAQPCPPGWGSGRICREPGWARLSREGCLGKAGTQPRASSLLSQQCPDQAAVLTSSPDQLPSSPSRPSGPPTTSMPLACSQQAAPSLSWRANPFLSLALWANNVFLIETCSASPSFFLFQISSASASKIRACVAGVFWGFFFFRKCEGVFFLFFCKISTLWLWKRNHCGESIPWNDDRSKIIFLCRKQRHLKTGLTSLFFVPGSVNSQAPGPLILPHS